MGEKCRILVTGGCGFVGRHLIQHLINESVVEIWIVDDLSTGIHPAGWEKPKLQLTKSQLHRNAITFEDMETNSEVIFINADFASIAYSEIGRQPGFGMPKLPHFNEVYHLASVVGGRAMIEGDPLAVGIDLSIDASFFLWAAKVNKPDYILYASSSAAYPVALQTDGKSLALSEDMINFNSDMSQPDYTYGWSKLTGEFLAAVAADKYDLNVAVVRPFSGYGEDQDPTYPVPAIALRVAARQDPVHVWGSGLQGRDFVHIDDCAVACTIACRNITDGTPVNIGSGMLTSFKELAALMIRLEGYNAPVQGTDNRPVGVAQRYCNTDFMKKRLNWEPTISLEEGMRRVLDKAKHRLEIGFKPHL